MTDIAIRVNNLSKLYPARSLAVWRPGVGWARHLGAVHKRPDTLRDALTGWMPRTLAPHARAGVSQISRIGDRKNPSNPPLGPWQAPHSPDDLWALKDVSFYDHTPILDSFRLERRGRDQ